MKITVINGTEKHGVTYRLKEIFLSAFKDNADITEYFLPKDCPNFCIGCTNCVLKGESTCKDAETIRAIEQALLEADLIVMTSPAYVFHVTGAMKSFLDHFAYRWIPHRPAPEMFGKRAVILTQCLGAGAKSAAKDIKHSLSWWGISEIGIFTGALMSNTLWDKLPEQKQAELTKKVKKLSKTFARIDYTKPAHTNMITKIKFSFCRMLQKSLHKADPDYLDGSYWAQQGWLDGVRPWKPTARHNNPKGSSAKPQIQGEKSA
ncbi:MAG: flavodoxin family protein [Acutalibacteraceae bacterium]